MDWRPGALCHWSVVMCRNIRTLFNFDPPATPEEIRAASLQFVRKITGFNKPSKANEASFLAAVNSIADASSRLLGSLDTNAPAKNREQEEAKARLRGAERFRGVQTTQEPSALHSHVRHATIPKRQ